MTHPPFDLPIIAAPMAGGVSTPALVAAAASAGGFGYLAAGYLTAPALAERIEATRELTGAPFGVNLFVPEPVDPSPALDDYREELAPEAQRLGVVLPQADWTDTDHWADKLDLLLAKPVPVVSFTFGLPSEDEVAALHRADTALVATVTTIEEARDALGLGMDALCVQGPDAGGHRATHSMTAEPGQTSLDELVREIVGFTSVPVFAAGGVATRERVAELLGMGAAAVQVGTALLRTPEAGTSGAYRDALARHAVKSDRRDTLLTRAFSGRPARGLRNRFIAAHDAAAPPLYPQVNQLTGPLRRAAAAAGDAESLSLWAGTGYPLATEEPAAEVIRGLAGR